MKMKNSQRMLLGIRNIWNQKWKSLFLTLYGFFVFTMWEKGHEHMPVCEITALSQLYVWLFDVFMIEIAVIGICVILIALGTPLHTKKVKMQLSESNIGNLLKDIPILTDYAKKGKITVYEFFSKIITLSKYREHQGDLEVALNIQIESIEQGRNKQYVLIKGVSAKNKFPDMVKWDNSYLSEKDYELVLGVSLTKREIIEINTIPHILLGGGTGSGKTMLLKLLIAQCIEREAIVYICDFKGGIDYPQIWHEKCSFITTAEEMNEKLEKVLDIMKERGKTLEMYGCSNVCEYNKKSKTKMNRIVVACDEIAEVLDKTGLDKEQKALVSQIENKLSTVARLGRAFGEHLFLCTQRPSAEIIKGEIKDNLGHRICGRCDIVLSQIILDNSNGAEKIPHNGQGMFLTNSGVLFKAYYIDDNYPKEKK